MNTVLLSEMTDGMIIAELLKASRPHQGMLPFAYYGESDLGVQDAIVFSWAEVNDDLIEESNFRVARQDLVGRFGVENVWVEIFSGAGQVHHLIARVLDEDGYPTDVGRAAVQLIRGLEEYPILNDEDHSDLQSEKWDEMVDVYMNGHLTYEELSWYADDYGMDWDSVKGSLPIREIDDFDAYAYKASIYCRQCGNDISLKLIRQGVEPVAESDKFPVEIETDVSDYPVHCERCLGLLTNFELTEDGVDMILEELAHAVDTSAEDTRVTDLWVDLIPDSKLDDEGQEVLDRYRKYRATRDYRFTWDHLSINLSGENLIQFVFDGQVVGYTYKDTDPDLVRPMWVVNLKRKDGSLTVDRLNDYGQVRQYFVYNIGYCI